MHGSSNIGTVTGSSAGANGTSSGASASVYSGSALRLVLELRDLTRLPGVHAAVHQVSDFLPACRRVLWI